MAERRLGPGTRAFEFRRAGDNGRVLVAWALPAEGAEIQLPAEWASAKARALDLMGNMWIVDDAHVRLTRLPVYWVTIQ